MSAISAFCSSFTITVVSQCNWVRYPLSVGNRPSLSAEHRPHRLQAYAKAVAPKFQYKFRKKCHQSKGNRAHECRTCRVHTILYIYSCFISVINSRAYAMRPAANANQPEKNKRQLTVIAVAVENSATCCCSLGLQYACAFVCRIHLVRCQCSLSNSHFAWFFFRAVSIVCTDLCQCNSNVCVTQRQRTAQASFGLVGNQYQTK